MLPVILRQPLLRLPLQGFCLFVVLGMGPASVYTGAHWPSDVLGSYVLSALYLALALRYYRRWRHHPQRMGNGQTDGNSRAIRSPIGYPL
jgi:membrane-associated phospholipid phosphatase